MMIPRPRLTVRRLIILVALAGLALGIGIEWNQRVKRFQERAFHHGVYSLGSKYDFGKSFKPKRVWHMAMAKKYNYFASRPWLSVPPDPPEPE